MYPGSIMIAAALTTLASFRKDVSCVEGTTQNGSTPGEEKQIWLRVLATNSQRTIDILGGCSRDRTGKI